MNLRFARAYRVFLVNAKLWRADLEGAYLSEADLRGANLREATLRSANLDRAQANHAVFVSATPWVRSSFRPTLRGADLSYGNFDNADLSNAKAVRCVDVCRLDARRAFAESGFVADGFARYQDGPRGVVFREFAGSGFVFRQTGRGKSCSAAQLKGAILLDADLKNADLRGAFLSGALLRGAEIDGANLSWRRPAGSGGIVGGADLFRALARRFD